MRVLYVENHPTFARTVVAQFMQEHAVTVVRSIAEASAMIASEPFDVMLIDFDLDDGKGDEFVRHVRSLGLRLPIVACSAHEMGNGRLLDAGANVVCAKSSFGTIGRVLRHLVQLPDRRP
jgi:CheY-like chemotaxis protein